MIDLSGTVHVGKNLLPGVKEAIHKLKSNNIPIKYVTNSSKESRRSLAAKVQNAGLEITCDEIFTSLLAARDYTISKNLRPLLMLEKEALEDFQGLQTDNPNSVVVGLAPSQFTYSKMNEAFCLLKNGASLVAINKSRYFKKDEGLAIGTGAFVTALEFASDSQAHVVGKPSTQFFHLALQAFGMASLVPEEVLMVGDDIRDDVLGAQQAGLQGGLVKTGKYLEDDEKKYGDPSYVFTDLMEMSNFVVKQKTA